jgi:hypothetical protein
VKSLDSEGYFKELEKDNVYRLTVKEKFEFAFYIFLMLALLVGTVVAFISVI